MWQQLYNLSLLVGSTLNYRTISVISSYYYIRPIYLYTTFVTNKNNNKYCLFCPNCPYQYFLILVFHNLIQELHLGSFIPHERDNTGKWSLAWKRIVLELYHRDVEQLLCLDSTPNDSIMIIYHYPYHKMIQLPRFCRVKHGIDT